MPRRLLIPIDGSAPATEALSYAIETFPDAEFVLVHVLTPADSGMSADGLLGDPSSMVSGQRERAEALFEEAKATLGEDTAVETALLAGRPATEIVNYASENEFDGIVMGSHGRDGAARLLLGSVSETVVRRSPIPVTVVR